VSGLFYTTSGVYFVCPFLVRREVYDVMSFHMSCVHQANMAHLVLGAFNLHIKHNTHTPHATSTSQLTIKDLSWEDKELVLRVLFAKMNGVAGGTSSATNQMYSNNTTAHPGAGSGKRMQEPMPMPVSDGVVICCNT